MSLIQDTLLIFLGFMLGTLVCLILVSTNTFPFDNQIYAEADGNCSYLYDGCWASVQEGRDWVCINADDDMSYKRCVEVAQHECGHKLFAEKCEKNVSKCLEVDGS